MLEGLDNRMKRQVALAMLITLVDSNDGMALHYSMGM